MIREVVLLIGRRSTYKRWNIATWSENVDRLLRRVDNLQVGIERVVGREERRDRALMSALRRMKSATVV